MQRTLGVGESFLHLSTVIIRVTIQISASMLGKAQSFHHNLFVFGYILIQPLLCRYSLRITPGPGATRSR
ncbi:hypothetical protein M2375_001194 [Comamonas sp. BIGb0152]|nr:hypothetical protein [Comamonas sp. BIGb0152]